MITQKIIARTDSLKLNKIISRYGEDSMRQVVFIIVRPDPESEELIPITIPEDAVGSFRILKPSGNFVIVPMSKSVLTTGETAFDVVLPASANTAKGSGYYDIRITSESDKYYFTAQGDFLIDDNIISDEVLEDVSEVNGLIFPDDFLTREDAGAVIDDTTTSTDTTWSSNKISSELSAITITPVFNAVSLSSSDISINYQDYKALVVYVSDSMSQCGTSFVFTKDYLDYCRTNSRKLVLFPYGSAYVAYNILTDKLEYADDNNQGFYIIRIDGVNF